jgi:hypothetical protein
MGSNPQSCPVSRVADKGSPLYWGFHVIIRKAKSWTIVGNVFGECHNLCTLNTSYVDLEKK